MRKINVHPGQKVVTTAGNIETVAFVLFDQAFVYRSNGHFCMVEVVGDAWGGEHDQEMGLAA
jgi:hypothetical protein